MHSPFAPLLVLLTDFGTRDPFVGVMKGVILSRCPDARIVDLTHEIAPQQIIEGAFWLARSARWFPPETVFVAVVDPGVGTRRRAIAGESENRLFVGPDNGLLYPVLAREPRVVREIDVRRLGLPEPSATFHGRDVFAPVAADLAGRKLSLPELGPPLQDLHPLEGAPPIVEEGHVRGMVITVDRFGNLITNIDAECLSRFREPTLVVQNRTLPLTRTYGEAAPGSLLALVNAFDALEIAVRNGSAAQTLGLGRGAAVSLIDRKS